MTIAFVLMVLWVCFIVYKITGNNESITAMVAIFLLLVAVFG